MSRNTGISYLLLCYRLSGYINDADGSWLTGTTCDPDLKFTGRRVRISDYVVACVKRRRGFKFAVTANWMNRIAAIKFSPVYIVATSMSFNFIRDIDAIHVRNMACISV